MGRQKIQLDKVVVVDVESTCWDSRPPEGQISDIIEVGVCLLDMKTLKPEAKRSILVRPASSKVSSFCTELTTLTQEMVDGGVSFAEACEILRDEFQADRRVFASYGDYDRNQFKKQCQLYGVRYPFGPRHLNVKTWAALRQGRSREAGMPRAAEWYNLEVEGTHHRGHDDAWNIAKILGRALS